MHLAVSCTTYPSQQRHLLTEQYAQSDEISLIIGYAINSIEHYEFHLNGTLLKVKYVKSKSYFFHSITSNLLFYRLILKLLIINT